jgi:hypothetical protein
MIYHHAIGDAVARERIASLLTEASAQSLAAQAAPRRRRPPLRSLRRAWRRLTGVAPVVEPSP